MIFNKKGAMFGLFRALRKQSSELFLAKMQSSDSQETRDSFKTNRGAMFGLDARIALAIFGALSVISGAALYSAIQQSKITAVITDLNELGKAFEQYLLDTGEELPRNALSGTTIFHPNALITDPGITGWKGPYIPYTKYKNANKSFVYSSYSESNGISVRLLSEKDWGTGTFAASDTLCSGNDRCYVWIQVYVPNALAAAIDLEIDGSATPITGNLRMYDNSDGYTAVYLKYMPSFIENNNSL